MPYTVDDKDQYVIRETKMTITDIDIPFVRLVMVMVKVALAAIPAAFIIGLVYMIIAALFFGGL